MLRARQIEVSDPEYIARTAWTTDELADAIAEAKPQGRYDLVSLLVGVNDQYRGRPVGAFVTEFQPVLRKAVQLAGRRAARTVVLSIPDWGATPFADTAKKGDISREIDAYNVRAREMTLAAKARWVDVTAVSLGMRTDRALVATDGLHPSSELYRRWAELALPEVLGALRAERESTARLRINTETNDN